MAAEPRSTSPNRADFAGLLPLRWLRFRRGTARTSLDAGVVQGVEGSLSVGPGRSARTSRGRISGRTSVACSGTRDAEWAPGPAPFRFDGTGVGGLGGLTTEEMVGGVGICFLDRCPFKEVEN